SRSLQRGGAEQIPGDRGDRLEVDTIERPREHDRDTTVRRQRAPDTVGEPEDAVLEDGAGGSRPVACPCARRRNRDDRALVAGNRGAHRRGATLPPRGGAGQHAHVLGLTEPRPFRRRVWCAPTPRSASACQWGLALELRWNYGDEPSPPLAVQALLPLQGRSGRQAFLPTDRSETR